MNQQEIFNAMVKGLAAQGFKQSKNEHGCKFRGNDGMKCALGQLVTDEELAALKIVPDREPPAYRVSQFILQKMESTGEQYLALSDQNLLWDAQMAHDCSGGPDDMKEKLAKVAKKFGLAVPSELDIQKTE